MKIGFFDSGIGGMTVLYDTLKVLPNEDYVYYADTANVPYGPKPKEEVRKYIFNAIDFLVNEGVKAVVIACNTATSVAIEELRKKYSIPIIGMEPAVKPAVKNSKDLEKRVLVTATALTIKEKKLHNLIDRVDDEHIVDLIALPELVKFSEKLNFDDKIVLSYLKEELKQFNLNDYGTIVLGCTHFSYFKDKFKTIIPSDIKIIDGNLGTANNLKRILGEKGLLNQGSKNITFYNSGIKVEKPEELERYTKLFERLKSIDE